MSEAELSIFRSFPDPEFPDPEVSVILPVYNGAHSILTQLHALVDQADPPPYEVIVVDNGSSDGTAAVVKAFIALRTGRIPSIRIVDASREQGVSYARNIGISVARASKLMFCDADDCVSEFWVQHGCRLLDGAAVVSGAAIPVDDTDFFDDVAWLRERIGDRPEMEPAVDDQRDVAFPVLMGGSFGMTRRTALDIGGFDRSLPVSGEDNDLALRLRAAGIPVLSTGCMRVAYRIRTGSRRLAVATRRAARAHVLIALRHGLWDESPMLGNGRLLSEAVRMGPAITRWAFSSPRSEWRDVVSRLAVTSGLLEGAVVYRLFRRVPPAKLGVGPIDERGRPLDVQ